jgi:hypothetical protein
LPDPFRSGPHARDGQPTNHNNEEEKWLLS